MPGTTHELAEFVANLSYEALPAAVPERVKALTLDLLAIALRARHEAESTPSLLAAVERLGLAGGEATVVGHDAGFAPPGAALINGALAHSLDFDDTHARASVHVGAPVVPAALAAAEMSGAGGREVIAGIVAGSEVLIRLGLALIPKDHYERGFHPTATCGAFGAAAAAARVFGLATGRVAHAFGIALSQSAGSMQFHVNGAWTKRYQVGHAALCGLVAASLAREGFTGAAQAIEGEAGFLRTYAPDPRPELATEGLGEVYETLAVAVKPYPCCRYAHAAMDALIALRAEHGIVPEEVEAVEIGLPQRGLAAVGTPEEAKRRPGNVVDGQFSMPFLAAVALRQGAMGWDDYARHLEDGETLALCRRVATVVDPRAEAEYPAQMSGAARVRTARGDFEAFVATPKGEPETFPTAPERRAKVDALIGPYLPPRQADMLVDAVLSLEEAVDIGALLRLTRGSGATPVEAAAG